MSLASFVSSPSFGPATRCSRSPTSHAGAARRPRRPPRTVAWRSSSASPTAVRVAPLASELSARHGRSSRRNRHHVRRDPWRELARLLRGQARRPSPRDRRGRHLGGERRQVGCPARERRRGTRASCQMPRLALRLRRLARPLHLLLSRALSSTSSATRRAARSFANAGSSTPAGSAGSAPHARRSPSTTRFREGCGRRSATTERAGGEAPRTTSPSGFSRAPDLWRRTGSESNTGRARTRSRAKYDGFPPSRKRG